MTTKIKIINLNCGNINSVENAFKFLKCETFVQKNFEDLNNCDGIVIPGNGNFQHVSEELKKRDKNKLLELIDTQKIPLLGICIGFQILFEKGFENSTISNGLGLFEGNIQKINNNEKINYFSLPHIGWNTVKLKKKSPLFDQINDNSSFYFLHSFVCNKIELNSCLGFTNYGEDFISIINKKNIVGVQFHPEKSHNNGLQFLRNWLRYYVKN